MGRETTEWLEDESYCRKTGEGEVIDIKTRAGPAVAPAEGGRCPRDTRLPHSRPEIGLTSILT